MSLEECRECTETSITCPISGKKCFFYSENIDNGTISEFPIRTLTRLIAWEIKEAQKVSSHLRSEGGFAYAVTHYRGYISGLKKVLDLIDWYRITDEAKK